MLNDFCRTNGNTFHMATRSNTSSSSSTILLVVILALTFPFWIGICAGLFGLMVGLFGALFGIMAGLFGAIIGLIALPFKLIFDWGGDGWSHHFHFGGIFIVCLVVVLAAMISRRK